MKLRLIIISCVLSVIPLILLQSYYYYSTERILVKGKETSIERDFLSAAEDIVEKINTANTTLNLLSQLSLPKVSLEYNRPEALNNLLEASSDEKSIFERVVVFDANREFFASGLKGVDVFSLIDRHSKLKDVVSELVNNKKKELVKVVADDHSGKLQVLSAVPIFNDDSEIRGFIVAKIKDRVFEYPLKRLGDKLKIDGGVVELVNLRTQKVDNDKICNSVLAAGADRLALCRSKVSDNSFTFIRKNFFIIFLALIFLGLIYAMLYQFFIGRILSPLYQFLQNLTKITEGNFIKQSEDSKYHEINALISSTNSIVDKLKSSQEQEIEKVRIESVAKVATQAAHDIRSPLEVLKSLNDEMAHFPDSARKRIQLSVNRIEEITFNLLKKHKESVGINAELKNYELLGVLTSVLTEKTIEFRDFDNLIIEHNFDSNCYGIFSRIDRVSFKGLISNLVNNAAEAIGSSSGVIRVELINDLKNNIIKIIDNGSGIPKSITPNLFTKGFTTKKNGNGLGLYNAKQDIEAAGGTISFESEVGKGTTFTITLPKSEAPETFLHSINVDEFERIIVLDDDPAFHEVWSKRLSCVEGKLEHIFSVKEMLTKYHALHPKILLLSDFELMDKEMDGIDTVIKLNHASKSVLVTARSEELTIQERCLKAGIKLLPKSLVNYVNVLKDLSESSHAQLESATMVGDFSGFTDGIVGAKVLDYSEQAKLDQVEVGLGRGNDYLAGDLQIGQNQKSQVVLIEDEKLIRLNWSIYCKKNGFDFQSFKSIDEFLEASNSFDKSCKIYIDSNLGDGIKGEIESEKIFKLGYENLYLATGYGKEFVKKPSWIIEVYSKSPEIIS